MKIRSLCIGMCVVACLNLPAQNIESSFHSPVTKRAAYISTLKVQPDNKILIAGDISFYEEDRVGNLIRISPEGSLDDSFSFAKGNELLVEKVDLLPDGKIVVMARAYLSYNLSYMDENYLLILNSDGSVVKEIAIDTNSSDFAIQSDGKIVLSGRRVTRYNSDLAPDTDFNAKVITDEAVSSVFIHGEHIFIAGSFSSVNGEPHNDIARLDLNGNVDPSFSTGTGTTDYIGRIVVQPDGKILPGRTYINSFNGQQFGGMVRLNADGSVDTAFNPPRLNGGVSEAYVTDEGIYVAAFLHYGDQTLDRFFRLHPLTGEIDLSFPPVVLDQFGSWDLNANFIDNTIFLSNSQKTGNIFGFSALDQSGNYLDTFKPEIARFGTIEHGDLFGGKLLVAGDFLRIDGLESYGVARIDLDGRVDESFRMKTNKGAVLQLKVLDDNNALVSTGKNFFKLDANGDERPEFSWSHFKNLYSVWKFIVLGNNKIMAADPNLLYRLHENGSEDETFNVGPLCCWVSTLFDYDLQDNKVIYGSAFEELGGTAVNRLARLNEDGSVDVSFNTSGGPDDDVALVKVLKNNDIIVGGFFGQFGGVSVPHGLVRLSPDGTLNRTFNENQRYSVAPKYGIFFNPQVEELGSQIIFRGSNALYVMNADGTTDPAFNIPAETGAITDIIAVDAVENEGGRAKTDAGTLFTFGNFTLANSNTVSLLKLSVARTERPQSPDAVTALQEGTGKLDVVLYPQPVSNTINLAMVETGAFDAEIIDSFGRKVRQQSFDKGKEDAGLPVDGLTAGVYFLKITGSGGKKNVLKFAKVN